MHERASHGDRAADRNRAGGRASRGRAGRLRHHRRPGEGDDVPLALPAGAARAARLPDRRRRGRRLDGRPAARARARVDRGHRASRSTRRSSTASRRGSPTSPATSATPRPTTRVGDGDRAAASGRSSTSRSRRSCSARSSRASRTPGLTEDRARSSSRSRSATTSLRPRARRRAAPVHRRVAALPDRPLPREDGPRGDPLPALREHDARAGLEPELRRVASRSRWPRSFGVEDRGHFYDPVGALRDVVVNHLMQVVAAARDGGARRRRPGRRSRTRRSRSSARSRRPTRRTTSAASTTATSAIDGVAPDSTTETYAALRLEIENWRWSGVPFFIRTGKRLPATQTELRLVFKHAAAARLRARRRAAGAEPARHQARPVDRAPARRSTPTGPTRRAPSRSRSTWSSPSEGGEGADAVRGAAPRRDGRRQHALHPPGRRRGDVARSCSRCSTRRRPSTPTRRDRGARPRPTRSSPATAAGTAPGSRREATAAPPRPARRRAPPRRRRSRRSRTTPSSRTATPARSSRPTARSTGSASPASTRRASSAACSTGRPGSSASRRSASTIPTARAYEPGTNVLVTTWKTPSGWVVVRDALTIGPRDARGRDHAAHAAAGRRRRRPHARAHGRVPRGPGRGRARLRAVVRLRPRRRPSGRSSTAAATRPTRPAPGRRSGSQSDLALGIEGSRVRGRHVLQAGERAYCALSWAEGLAGPADVDDAEARIAATARFWRAWLGRARIPDHRWRDPIQRSALAIKGLTYMPTGATVAALTTSLPETPGRRAQLGLPLHLDARHDLHAAGAALPQPRLGGRRVHAVRRRPRAERGRRRCRSCTGSTAAAT